MSDVQKINAEILSVYEQWRREIKEKCPYLLSESFSNIFCTGVKEGWSDADVRILIVGEEARWKSRKYYNYSDADELKECQKWIINEIRTQLYDDTIKKHKSGFWRRIRKLHSAFPEAQFCWTNIDVINTKWGNALKERDRKSLHSCDTQVLREVVRLLEPTHIVFFGWHNTSLLHEFPELSRIIYPNNQGDNSLMKENGYIFKTDYECKTVVFTYHPNSRQARSNSYTEELINTLVHR